MEVVLAPPDNHNDHVEDDNCAKKDTCPVVLCSAIGEGAGGIGGGAGMVDITGGA